MLRTGAGVLQTQRRRRTQRPRRPLRVEVGPSAGREQDWFWVALLRAALEEREKREKVKSVKRTLVALLRLEPAPWRGCFRYGESRSFGAREFLHFLQDSKTPGSGSNGRRVTGCGAEPRQNEPRTMRPGAAGCREANESASVFRPGSVFLSNTSLAAA